MKRLLTIAAMVSLLPLRTRAGNCAHQCIGVRHEYEL